MGRTGVLLMAFGGPRTLAEVEPFMTALIGSVPPAAAVSEAQRKYLTIGGGSPLPGMAERIAVQLERALSGLEPAEVPESGMFTPPGFAPKLARAVDPKMPVHVGMRYAEPSIDHAVDALAAEGVTNLVVVPLSPFEAEVTTGAYDAAVRSAVERHAGMRVIDAPAYRRTDAFLGLYADGVTEALADMDQGSRALVVFSAHSLPVADVEKDPAYTDQIRTAATEVAQRAGLGDADGFGALAGIDAFGGEGGSVPWLLSFQSKGRRGGEWVGPDLDDVIDAAAAAGFGTVIVCPVGFALDHMETLYDLDVCAADRVLNAEMEFVRTRVPNDDSQFIEALADSVRRAI